jgi:hypothetical protein
MFSPSSQDLSDRFLISSLPITDSQRVRIEKEQELQPPRKYTNIFSHVELNSSTCADKTISSLELIYIVKVANTVVYIHSIFANETVRSTAMSHLHTSS